jgi:hypothetical protein
MKRVLLVVGAWLLIVAAACGAQPLPSWNEGPAKEAIMKFVRDVTTDGGPTYVAQDDRIAVFDNDGTLWPERPPVELAFALDRVKALAPQHPEWKDREPFKSILAGDVAKALAGGEKAAAELMAATHAGMTTDAFAADVRAWIENARHPRFERPYTHLAYEPMLELLAYLREHGFRTFIVSGGGVEFMRPWAQKVYGVAPEQVIGSQGGLRFELREGRPVLVKLAELDFVDDKAGKPVAIQKHIGRRPLVAVGNSDGDFEMLEWTTSAPGARLGLLVHHTDAAREFAYDRHAGPFTLDKAWDEAAAKGWIVVDMKRDWKRVFAFE